MASIPTDNDFESMIEWRPMSDCIVNNPTFLTAHSAVSSVVFGASVSWDTGIMFLVDGRQKPYGADKFSALGAKVFP